ncbi:MAG: glycosyltransferase family 4 protein [Acidobacteriota bacterium]|jgi:glycosyltransferase involved in cell wall biosynthesis
MPEAALRLHGKSEAIRRLLRDRRARAASLEIDCRSVDAIEQKDLADALLRVLGARDWRWVDDAGGTAAPTPMPAALLHLARDLAAWPGLYLLRRAEILGLPGPAGLRPGYRPGSSCLYLRTAHWFNLRSGGSVAHVRGVISSLRELGTHVEVVSTDRLAGVPEDDAFHRCPPDYGLGRNLKHMPELRYNRQIVGFVERRWESMRPGFLYERLGLGSWAGACLRKRHRVPLVLEYNGSEIWIARNWGAGRPPFAGLLRRIEDVSLAAADVIVAVSDPLREELVARGVDAGKILVNPNGVDAGEYTPGLDGAAARRRLGFGDELVVGFIGTFGPWHGAEVLADAFGLLLEQVPDYRPRVRLLLIGDGGRMATVRANLERHRIRNEAVLTGLVPQEEGPGLLAACDILVSPHVPNPDGSRFFGSPTKLFEYMAMGKPIVASSLDQIGEILEHDGTAWLVAPGDAGALAGGLRILIEDFGRRQRLGAAARAVAVSRHTWTAHTGRILQALADRCPAR